MKRETMQHEEDSSEHSASQAPAEQVSAPRSIPARLWAAWQRACRALRALPLDLPAAQRHWWQSPLGQRLLSEEGGVLARALQGSYGVHWGLLGPYPGYREELAADIAHGFQFGHEIEPGAPIALRNDAAAWPLASETLTAVVLPHAYAHAEDPHGLLREAHRVLRAEGIVVVLGWNPWSLWGVRIVLSRIWQIVTRRRVRYPWCTRLLTAGRLREWCSVLGFEIVRVRHYGYQLPINTVRAEGVLQRIASGLRRLRLAPFAGGYCLVARKHVLPLTPIRPRWARRSVTVGAMVGQRAVESGTLPRMPHTSDSISHDRRD
ncbi:MAG: class I SAM-dependent methyltransferase [Gammaproteobacteria bacterium]